MRAAGRERRPWIDVGAAAALVAVAASGWAATFTGWHWVPAATVGLVLGAATGVAGARWRWPALLVAGVTVLAYVLLTAPVVVPSTLWGVLPTWRSLTALLAGAVTTWKAVLTVPAPLDIGGAAGTSAPVLVAPLLSTQLAAVTAVSAALRLRPVWPALAPPAVLLLLVVLLGTDVPTAPTTRVVVFVALALAWGAWRRAQVGASARGRRAGGAVLVLGVGALSAALLAPWVGAGDARWVPRDSVVPPFDPHDYPSPLSAYRAYVKAAKDVPQLTVTGAPAGSRVRMATLDDFDGTVWNVAGSRPAPASGRFLALPAQGVAAPAGSPTSARRVDVTVGIRGYRGVWLPTVGQTTRVVPTARLASAALYVNTAAGAVVDGQGVASGDRYSLQALVAAPPTAARIAAADAAPASLPAARTVPPAVAARAAQLTVGAHTDGQRAQDLADGLARTGYFSDGLTGEAPSAAGHGAFRIAQMLDGDEMVGDSEQYASLMALMGREVGLPTRVVLGFRVPSPAGSADAVSTADGARRTVTVTGSDIVAWTEVDLSGLGWVAFDPTPTRERVPAPTSPRPHTQPQDSSPQAPPSLTSPPDSQSGATGDRSHATPRPRGLLLRLAEPVGVPLLAVLVLIGAPLSAKALRRRRRARRGDGGQRVVGAWAEFLDAAHDLGSPSPPRHATRREAVSALPAAARPEALALATRADAGAFAPTVPTPSEVDAYWRDVASATDRLRAQVPWRRRVWARVNPASLVARRPARRRS